MIDKITLVNTSSEESIVLDADSFDYVLTKADLGTVKSSHNTSKYPGQVGVQNISATLETRDIVLEGWVVGDTVTEIEKRKAALNRLVNPLEELNAVVNKVKLTFMPDFSIQYSSLRSENNEYLCKFIIQGSCSYPLFSSLFDVEKPISTTIPMFHFPLVIPKTTGVVMSIRQAQRILTVINEGDVETGITITLKANNTVVNPVITEVLTQKHIYIDKTLEAGETVVICTEKGRKKVTGVNGLTPSNYFKYFRIESDWIQMLRGRNVFQYDCDSGSENLFVSISYSPKFLEVD